MATESEIAHSFGPYRKPTDENIPKFEKIQQETMKLAHLINELCPERREKDMALRSLFNTRMQANAAIALSQDTPEVTVGS